MASSHLILCRSLLLLPPIPPSIRGFSNESTLRMRWSKYWSFSFSIIPSKEHPGLISFRMDWLDLLAVQGTLKSLLQHHVQKHQFFSTQLFYGPTFTSIHKFSSVQSLSHVQLFATLCSTPGLPVHHQLLEFAQLHVHRVGDAIQPSHPLLSPSPPVFNLSQHQGLFQ